MFSQHDGFSLVLRAYNDVRPTMMSEPAEKPTVFISYSHKDEKWKDLLRSHLGVLEQTDRITVWDDRQIDGGAEWYPEIVAAMERAV